MAQVQSRAPRQPKLRASCNACGAAKLKCDRGQPECGRCVSQRMECVYGVSRKTGKPPRIGILDTAGAARTPREQGGRASNKDRENGSSSGASDFLNDAMSGVDGFPDSLGANLDALHALTGNELFEVPIPDFASLDFKKAFSNVEAGAHLALESPITGAFATPAAQIDLSQVPADEGRCMDGGALLLPTPDSEAHDCFREAYEVLGRLSFHDDDARSTSHQSASDSPSTAAGSTTQHVPLDCVLRLNREASERLTGLLTCSCASSPHLALLHVSIIARVMVWYQQAAGCIQSPTWGPPVAPDLNSLSQPMSFSGGPSSSRSGSASSFSPWSSAAASQFSAATSQFSTANTTPAGLGVRPSKMVVGTFDVDDLHGQTALQIQLLLGEMRRAGQLIDQFTTLHGSSGQSLPNEFNLGGGVNNLFQTLDSWLRNEHSRIANLMRSKRTKLDTK